MAHVLSFIAAMLVVAGILAGPAAAMPGDLDPSFGNGGKVVSAFDSDSDRGRGVAVQNDGKTVVAGDDATLARYNSDGSLDAGFGAGGEVIAVISPLDVALQPDGKIVLSGTGRGRFAVARYNRDGSLDRGFGEGGRVVTDVPPPPTGGSVLLSSAQAIAVQPDGGIVAAGDALASFFGESSRAVVVARFTAGGRPDAGFGEEGVTVVGTGSSSFDTGVALQGDGRIVVATGDDSTGSSNFFVARFTREGNLDGSFNGNGAVTTNLRTDFNGFDSSDAASDVVIQNGKIVAAGYSGACEDADCLEYNDFAVVRYNSNGSLDGGFDGDGKAVTEMGAEDEIRALTAQADGRLVVAGCASCSSGGDSDFALARYTSDGALDAGFGTGGKVITPFGPGSADAANDLAIQCDGKVVAAGSTLEGSDDSFALARYEGTPTACPSSSAAAPPPSPPAESSAFAGCPILTANVIRGSVASNTITGTTGPDRIFAGTGNDVVDALPGNDCVDLGAGIDRGQGGLGDDLLLAGLGDDTVSGSSGNDRLSGDEGNDRLSGNTGNDRIFGGTGADVLFGGFGNDRLLGESGNDRISGSRGRDAINGGSGGDRISGDSSNDSIRGDSGNDRISGGSGSDRLQGNSGNDLISGGSGLDKILGDQGADRITGGPQRDRISAGAGNDRISTAGDRARDSVDCGPGRDTVIADRSDRVARNCEQVRRRR